MTRAANWNTRSEVQAQHIRWREQFYGIKFNVLQKAYAHFRMFFVNKDTIIGANCTLAQHVKDYGTAAKFAEAIGDTAFTATKGIDPVQGLKTAATWIIRAPFIPVALAGVILQFVGQGLQAGATFICQRLPKFG